MRRRVLWSALLLAPLAGCGFAPVYAPLAGGKGSPASQLGQVYVGVIPDRSGQELRQDLQVRLEGAGATGTRLYTLKVTYALTSEGIGIDPDTDVTFIRLHGGATWQLLGITPGTKALASGYATVEDGYSIVVNQYFFESLENDEVERRMAETLADQIVVRLAAYFRNRDKVAQK
jgi:LPS-assembly lipoprotein